jgi:TonB family protein
MSNFYHRQPKNGNSLILSLLLSLLVHGVIALILSRYQTQKFVSPEESLTPITIVELAEKENIETFSQRSEFNTPSKSAQNSPAIASPPKPPVKQNSPATTKPASTPPIPPTATETPKTEPLTTKPNVPQVTENNIQVASTPTAKPEKEIDPPTAKLKKPIENNKPINRLFENTNLAEKKPLTDLDKPASTQGLSSSKPLTQKRSLANLNRDPGDFAGTVANNSNGTSKTDKSGDDIDNNHTAANSNSNQSSAPLSIACKDNCQPEYPDVLDGVEGTAGIKLTLNRDGQVINAAIAISSGNSLLDEEAMKTAKQMEFSKIDHDRAIVQINLSFAVADDEEW